MLAYFLISICNFLIWQEGANTKGKGRMGLKPVYAECMLKAEGLLHVWQSSAPGPPL